MKFSKLMFIILTCIVLASCNMMPDNSQSIEDYIEIAKSDVESVIQAIETKDEILLKDMFSEYALKTMDDYSASFRQMTDFIDGEIVSSEISLAEESTSTLGAKRKIVIKYICKLATSSQKQYDVLVSDIVVNEQEKDNCGVYTVRVTSSDYQTSSAEPGIHLPQLSDGITEVK